MKKLFILPVIAVFAFAACKKKEDNVSILVTESYPTITIKGSQYYTIPVGGALPSIQATAYDSFYKESYDVVIDKSTLDNTKPGLNIVYASAKNKYGMKGSTAVYIAVTDVTATTDLSGKYYRVSNNDTVQVSKLSAGLYRTDNVGGVLYSVANAPFIIPAYFVHINDSTIEVPLQETSLGSLYGTNEFLSLAPADTFYQYTITGNANFGSALRKFKKI